MEKKDTVDISNMNKVKGLDNSKSAILSNLSKNIDVKKLIDNGILKISDDVKSYIDSVGYNIEDMLRLAFMYKMFLSLFKIEISLVETGEKAVLINILGKLYSMEVTVYPEKKIIHDLSMNVRLTPYVSGFKIFVEQVRFAKKYQYNYIYGFSGREETLDGYFYWPMLGFHAVPDLNIENLTQQSGNQMISSCKTLNHLFDLKNDNGDYIGLDFWKEHGFGFNAKFDLSDGSISLERLNEYILSKKQSNPEKYKDIDVIK